jgi:Histidine kinase-, DNA gyrase B-, and HSP90-like ATPase
MPDAPIQSSLFEEDYLLRELGQVAQVPQVALTELVANAWDAGATQVSLQLPAVLGGVLTVEDNGHGMSPDQFRLRWMTLRYDRLKRQSADVEFPPGKPHRPRKAYGRHGVGRHGLLCFANHYRVETWREGLLGTFEVATESGPSPFVLRSEVLGKRNGSGTKVSVVVERKLPDADEILAVLAARFVHDPEFEVRVNGATRSFSEIEGRVSEAVISLDGGRSATVIVIDTTRLNQSSIHQGIAFWVQRRLVGTPSWAVGQVANFDGRTRFARRYKVIVDTQGFEAEVEKDWTGFKASDAVRQLHQRMAEHIRKVAQDLAAEVVEESSADALTQNRTELASLGRGARLEVATFTKALAQAHPTISPDFLVTAVKAVINLERSKSGAALLQKLSALPPDDVVGLDQLLTEWTIKDALRVLDEIDGRISVIETIRRLAEDPTTDELHTLHPLILRSRWLFGPEFESEEYRSNATLQTVARELFKAPDAQFINERNRPDVVVLPDKTTCQLTGIESFDPADSTIVQLQHVLVIELKKGGFELTRKEVNQADGYVQDIAASGAMSGSPYICAWVVGQKVAAGVAKDKTVGDDARGYGRVRATTFGALVDTANRRLLKLRDALAERYGNASTDSLLERVFAQSALDI